MSRRLLAVLTAVCLAALGLSAVALAHGGSGAKTHKTAKQHAARHAAGAGLFGAALDSLAQRLAVAPADLKAAVKAVAAEERAKHPDNARPTPAELATLKTDLAAGLATKLGKTPDEVLTAVRAELDARLTQAVAAGWLTQKGHDLALGCFDTPASCDLKALRAEVRFFGHGKKRHHHGKRHHHKKPASAPSSTAPASTTAPSGTMTPGGRSSSAPLVG